MEKKAMKQQSNKENKSTDLRSGNVPPKSAMKNSPTNAVKKDQTVRSSAAEKKDAASLVKSTQKKETGSRVKSAPKKESGSAAKRKVAGSGGKSDSNTKK